MSDLVEVKNTCQHSIFSSTGVIKQDESAFVSRSDAKVLLKLNQVEAVKAVKEQKG